MSRSWIVQLTITATAYVTIPDDCDSAVAADVGRDAVAVRARSFGVVVEMDNVTADDVVEVSAEKADGEVIAMTPAYARLVGSLTQETPGGVK